MHPSTRLLTGLLAAASVLTAAACGGGDATARPDASTIDLPATAPATFEAKAMWQGPTSGRTPITSAAGVLTLQQVGDQPGTYRAALLDSASGQQRWATVPFLSTAAPPTLAETTQNGRAWAVVTVPDAANAVRVFGFDLSSGNQQTPVTTAQTFTGSRSAAPAITITDDGVLVSGAGKAPFQYRPDSGTRTVYRKGPMRGKQPGVPYLVHHDGFLVTYRAGGFAFATATGGWDSTASAPAGTIAAGGSVVRFANDLILSHWAGPGTSTTVAVQDLLTGRVLASQPVSDPAALADSASWSFVVADDGTTAAWGPYLFGLTDPALTRPVDLGGGQPVLIHQDVLYVSGMTRPVGAAPAAPTPTPSATPTTSATPAPSGRAPSAPPTAAAPSTPASTPSVSAPMPPGFTGNTALDVGTGAVVSDQSGMVPLAITPTNQGLFVAESAPSKDTLFAVALR